MTDQVLSLEPGTDKVEPNAQQTALKQEIDALKELVGDGKKFKNEEELARGKLEADQFIDKLKEEISGLRTDLNSALSEKQTNETRDELAKLRQELSQRQQEQGSKENTTPALAAEDLQSLIDARLKERETETRVKLNIERVNEALVKQFGDLEAAQKIVANRASELGVDAKYLANMAGISPAAALELIVPKGQQQTASLDAGSTVTAVPAQSGITGGLEVKADFDRLRKENKRKYWTPEIQNRIFELKKQGKYD